MRLRPAGDDVFAIFTIAAVIFSTILVYGEYHANGTAGRPMGHVTTTAR